MARHETFKDTKQVPKHFKIESRHIIDAMKNCENRIQYILKANGADSEEGLAEKRFERQCSWPVFTPTGDNGQQVTS